MVRALTITSISFFTSTQCFSFRNAIRFKHCCVYPCPRCPDLFGEYTGLSDVVR